MKKVIENNGIVYICPKCKMEEFVPYEKE